MDSKDFSQLPQLTALQEKALAGAFSVITNLRMELFEAPASAFKIEMFVRKEHNCSAVN